MQRLTILFLALSLCACSDRGSKPAPPDAGRAALEKKTKKYVAPKRAPLAAPHRVLKRPRIQKELPTTDWKSYRTNVAGQLRTTRKAFAQAPVSPTSRRQLGWRIYTWAELHRDPAHYQEAVDLASGGLEAAIPAAELLLLRAEAQFGLGRAQLALDDLAAAEALGSKSRRIASLRAEALWLLKRDAAAEKAMRDQLASRPGVHIMGRVALVERELGNLEAAEKLLATAETKIENTAPAPVAWLYVQRGLIHLEAGRTKQALRFLRAAHERATGYPLAVVALARAELVGGEAKRAVELLEPLVEEWPRALHHRWLAAAYAAAGRNTDAEGEWRRAESSCEAHFPKFPEAVAATCAEVSLERGNRAGALRYAAAAVKASPSRANRALLKAAADP